MKGPDSGDRPSGKKRPTSSSGAKPSSGRPSQRGRGSSKRTHERRHANNAASRRGRPHAKAGQRAQQASGSAKFTDGDPAKRIPISKWWGTLIGLASIAYFIYQTITVGFDYFSLFLTFAGLSLGAWWAVAWISVQFVRINWLVIIYLPVATTITLGLTAMSQPESLVFFNAPVTTAHGTCTGSPTGWIFHGFRPGQCAGVAFGRLGFVVAGGVVTLIMVGINRSIKWRARYLLDTGGRRRFMRNERRAWEFARRGQTKEQLNELRRRIAALRSDLKTYPHNSEEAARIRGEIKQLKAEHDNKFRTLLHDIHIYRKERRNERRQRRTQWQLKYWLLQHPHYAADPNSIISDPSNPTEGALNEARKRTDRSLSPSSPSKELSRPKIFDGPVKKRSKFKSYYAYNYCVKHWTKHYDIYVYIHQAAPTRIVKTAGRAALETVLKRGEAPNRIFIDSSGKIITEPFTSDFDPR
jgi:hypothetical protein